ncbi:hypothetical protein P7F88_12625 [Vibrio hannami]|uniref:hypothetical protein n=1 Tax=Vibrio hannami TaxID=2717094 RepID=UPI00240F2E41|nr:hypothetical protein [Vibrio hannami]MDG3086888.1 hypothetical protein [Vibrio hannami]
MKLPEIKKVRESVTAALSKLTAKGADDLDAVARERAVLREKLAMLDEAETAERDRLEAAESEAKAKERKVYLQAVAKSSRQAIEQHSKLTAEANALADKLANVLWQRGQVFNAENIGLTDNRVFDLLKDERKSLQAEIHRINSLHDELTVTPGAVTRELSNTDGLISRLAEGYADRPISSRTCAFCGKEHKTYTDDTAETCSQLCAENLANKRRRETMKPGDHYQADLRNASRVIDLNADDEY